MDLLVLLRILTLTVRCGLAAALLYLVFGRGRTMSAAARAAWAVTMVVYLVVALDNAAVEGFAVLAWQDSAPGFEALRLHFYNASYLVNALFSAGLPLALLAVYRGRRSIPLLLLLPAVVVLAAIGLTTGALERQQVLLHWTRVLSFVGVAGYLGFWATAALGRLRGLDVYFAGFLAVRTVFVLLLPVQEAFFQIMGRPLAGYFWELSEFLQLATGVAETVIVAALLITLARGSGVAAVRIPAPAA